MAAIRYYLDENIPTVIADQLRQRNIEAFSVRDLGQLGDDDENHLARATEMNCVFCTHDADFLRMATAGVQHSGVVFGQQEKHAIGDWVRELTLLHSLYEDADLINRVEFL